MDYCWCELNDKFYQVVKFYTEGFLFYMVYLVNRVNHSIYTCHTVNFFKIKEESIMSSDNYSVKASQETQEMVSQMVKASGCTSKEFFELVLRSYQMEAIKNGSTRHRELIRESEVMFSRINQIIVEMASKNDAEVLTIQNQLHEEELAHIEQTKVLEEKNNSFLASLKNAEDELKQALESKDTAEKQARSAADALAQGKELVFEYKSKIDILNTMATKNQTKVDAYDQAVAQVAKLSEQAKQIKAEHQREIEKMTEQAEQIEAEHQREMEIMSDNLHRTRDQAGKDQAAMLDKIEFLEKNFQNERNGFVQERSGFEARIMDLKNAIEREVQLIRENAEAKVETIAAQSVKPKIYLP